MPLIVSLRKGLAPKRWNKFNEKILLVTYLYDVVELG